MMPAPWTVNCIRACGLMLLVFGSASMSPAGQIKGDLTDRQKHQLGICKELQENECDSVNLEDRRILRRLLNQGFQLDLHVDFEAGISEERVVGLSLVAGPASVLPRYLAELDGLRSLSIDGKGFLRQVPAEIWKMPLLDRLSLANFQSLDSIVIRSNDPHAIKRLAVAQCGLEKLPAQFRRLENLERLSAGGNRLGRQSASDEKWLARFSPSWKLEQALEAPWEEFPEIPREVFVAKTVLDTMDMTMRRIRKIRGDLNPRLRKLLPRLIDVGKIEKQRMLHHVRRDGILYCDGGGDNYRHYVDGAVIYDTDAAQTVLLTSGEWSVLHRKIPKGSDPSTVIKHLGEPYAKEDGFLLYYFQDSLPEIDSNRMYALFQFVEGRLVAVEVEIISVGC